MHYRLITLISIFSLLFSLIFIGSGVSLSAQEQTQQRGLVLTPALVELDVEKGQSYQIELDIRNDTPDRNFNLIHTTETFEASADEGVPVLKEFSAGDPQKTWVGYPEPLIKLDAGEAKTSVVTLSIPTNASPGGYYFALIIGESGSANSADNKLLINSRVGTLLFVNVIGQVEKEVSFDNFQLDKQIYDPFFDSIDLQYKIRVSGNTFLKPAGNVFFGTQDSTGSINLNPDGKIILPNSSRVFQWHIPAANKLPRLFPTDNDKIIKGNVENVDKPWFGQKDIEVKIVYTDSNQDVSQKIVKKSVLFFPWKTIIFGLIVVAITYLLFFSGKILISKFKTKKI
jgi:hypothetical protein